MTDAATLEAPATAAATRRTVRLLSKRWEADGVVSLTFADPDGGALPEWRAGAHLSIHLSNGLVREYSLCSEPGAGVWTVAVLRKPDSRGGSEFVHDRLHVGSLVEVEGPRNTFALEPAGRYRLIAGGIGITPILAMARQLEETGAAWSLLYTGRSRASMAFLAEIEGFRGGAVTVHADDASGGRHPDIRAAVGDLAPDELVYVCGPEPLMAAVAAALPDEGPLRLERFAPPAEPARTAGGDSAFEIVCARSDRTVRVGADESALHALEAAGIPIASSCTEGICGTCEVAVLAGRVEHRDYVQTAAEQAMDRAMFVCVSRAASAELVLDL